MSERLRLRAADGEDLCVLAAVLQDARIPINEMLFERDSRRFMAAFRRVRRDWVPAGEPDDGCLSVLRLDHVTAVHWRGLEPGHPTAEHTVLTFLEERPGRLLLVFRDGEALRFDVTRIEATLDDYLPVDDPVAMSPPPLPGGERS